MELDAARARFQIALSDSLEKGRSGRERDDQVRVFMEVLDAMIEWSGKHSDVIGFERREKKGARKPKKPQERVAFYMKPGVSLSRYTTSPFWDSYPDEEPKLSFLEDRGHVPSGTGWTKELQLPLRSLKYVESDHYPTVRFNNLTGPTFRPRIAEITRHLEGVLQLLQDQK